MEKDLWQPTNELRFVSKLEPVSSSVCRKVKVLQQLWIKNVVYDGGIMKTLCIPDPNQKQWRDVPLVEDGEK